MSLVSNLIACMRSLPVSFRRACFNLDDAVLFEDITYDKTVLPDIPLSRPRMLPTVFDDRIERAILSCSLFVDPNGTVLRLQYAILGQSILGRIGTPAQEEQRSGIFSICVGRDKICKMKRVMSFEAKPCINTMRELNEEFTKLDRRSVVLERKFTH